MKVLHSICQQIWKMQQWPQDWERLKVEGEEGEEDKMVGWNHQFNGHELGKLREMMRERMAWRPAVHRVLNYTNEQIDSRD